MAEGGDVKIDQLFDSPGLSLLLMRPYIDRCSRNTFCFLAFYLRFTHVKPVMFTSVVRKIFFDRGKPP